MALYIPADVIKDVVEDLPDCRVDKKVLKLHLGKQYQQKTADWYEKRKSILTASDSATVIGKNPFSNRDKLLEIKANIIPRVDLSNNPAIEHGNKYEPIALKIYETMYPHLAPILEVGLVMHDVHHFLGASPDGVTANGILIEIKVPSLLHRCSTSQFSLSRLSFF